MSTCSSLLCPRAMDGDLCCMSCPENPDKDAYPPLVLELPFPPSVNHYWRSVRIGNATRTLISAAGRNFRQQVTQTVMAERKALRIGSGVAVSVTLHAPDNRRRDLDNFGGKALLDALTHAGVGGSTTARCGVCPWSGAKTCVAARPWYRSGG